MMDFREIKRRRWIGWYFPSNGKRFIALKIDEKQRFKKQVEICKKSIIT